MTRSLAAFALAAACSLLGACGGMTSSGDGSPGGADDSFAAQFCAKLASCGQPVANCEPEVAAILYSTTCQAAFLDATCADLTATAAPPDLAACLPHCASPDTAVCNGDGTVTLCDQDSIEETASCDRVCAATSKRFSGTCAASFGGQTSTTGQPVCWCE